MLLIRCVTLALIFRTAHGSRSFNIKWISYDHTFSTKFFRTVTLRLINYKGIRVLNGSAFLHTNVDDFDFTVRVGLLDKKKITIPWTMINVRLNACTMYDRKNKKGLSKVYYIVKLIQGNSHLFPEKCPILKDHEYYIKNFYFNPEVFPPNIPSMRLNVVVQYIHDEEVIYEGNVTAAVVANK